MTPVENCASRGSALELSHNVGSVATVATASSNLHRFASGEVAAVSQAAAWRGAGSQNAIHTYREVDNKLRLSSIGRVLISALLAQALFGANPAPMVSRTATLTIIARFDQGYSRITFQQMQRELDRIMLPARLQVEWRIFDAQTGDSVYTNLVFAHFRGKCATDVNWQTGERGWLGLTHISDGTILPFSDVDCDEIRQFVTPKLAGEGQYRSDQLLGQAMARVLAHEIYHIIVKTERHSTSGLSKPAFTPADLVDSVLRFGKQESDQIRAAAH